MNYSPLSGQLSETQNQILKEVVVAKEVKTAFVYYRLDPKFKRQYVCVYDFFSLIEF